MNADPLSVLIREVIQDAIVQRDELLEKRTCGIELQRQAALGEIDLHVVRALLEAQSDIGGGFVDQIGEERFTGIPPDAGLGVQQAQCGRRNHGLFHRQPGQPFRLRNIQGGACRVAKGSGREAGELTRMPVCERNDNTIWRESAHAIEGVRREARFGLFAVGNDR
jgi:hypothetical protein